MMKRAVVDLGGIINSRLKTKINFNSSSDYGYRRRRHLSHLVSPNGIPDAVAIARRLEADGLSSKKAEAIACAMAKAVCDALDHLSETYASRADMAIVRRLEAGGLPSKKAEAIGCAMTKALYDTLNNPSGTHVTRDEMTKIMADAVVAADATVNHGGNK